MELEMDQQQQQQQQQHHDSKLDGVFRNNDGNPKSSQSWSTYMLRLVCICLLVYCILSFIFLHGMVLSIIKTVHLKFSLNAIVMFIIIIVHAWCYVLLLLYTVLVNVLVKTIGVNI